MTLTTTNTWDPKLFINPISQSGGFIEIFINLLKAGYSYSTTNCFITLYLFNLLNKKFKFTYKKSRSLRLNQVKTPKFISLTVSQNTQTLLK